MKILLVCGGLSKEEEISALTALKVYNCLKSSREFLPYLIYQDPEDLEFYGGSGVLNLANYQERKGFKKAKLERKKGRNYLRIGRRNYEFDLVFPLVHGANTEDGTMASYFTTRGFYTLATSIVSSALAQDKILFKEFLKQMKIKTVRSVAIEKEKYIKENYLIASHLKNLKFPFIIKPYNLGSSIGIRVVQSINELLGALEDTFKITERILIEEYLEEKDEIDIAVIKDREGNYIFSAPELITTKDNFYTYDDKYLKPDVTKECPAKLREEELEEIKDKCKRVYKKIGFSGVVRFDFLRSNNTIYLNEVNTIPGSYSSNLFAPLGISIKTLVLTYLEESMDRIKGVFTYNKKETRLRFQGLNALDKLK